MPNVSVEDFRGGSVTHIVSLGPRCATTFNLRRHYDFASAYPFDWWITPARGLVDVLQAMDVERIYDPRDLVPTDGHRSVMHVPTGILLHHEFPRDASKPDAPVVETFLDAIDLPRDRTRYLFGKFLALDEPGNRVVFFREEGVGRDLEAALAPRFANCTWAVARIPSLPEDAYGWACDPAKWDALLAPFRLGLDRSRHRPFEATACGHGEGDFAQATGPRHAVAGEPAGRGTPPALLTRLKNRIRRLRG